MADTPEIGGSNEVESSWNIIKERKELDFERC